MTSWTTLVSAEELAAAIDHCVVIDCRHDLMNPAIGPEAYAADHIPGAYFLSQDTDLAGPKNGRNGRHPLPDRDALAAKLRAAGLDNGKQLVGYDASGGLYAARLWWLARWLGHRAVAVLDGGIDAWRKAGFPVTREVPAPRTGGFTIGAPLSQAATADDVLVNVGTGKRLVIDARGPERYRGETEPLDPVAGHIPGALNHPFSTNLQPDGRFLDSATLRARFDALLGSMPSRAVVQQCGSGVTACHNLLAMAVAGRGDSCLYPGSWSEWCSDPVRPVARG